VRFSGVKGRSVVKRQGSIQLIKEERSRGSSVQWKLRRSRCSARGTKYDPREKGRPQKRAVESGETTLPFP